MDLACLGSDDNGVNRGFQEAPGSFFEIFLYIPMVHGHGKDSRLSSTSRFTVTVRFKNTFRAITLLSVELQGSRSVHRDLRDDLYLHARRELRTVQKQVSGHNSALS